jgi:hypothetical protein
LFLAIEASECAKNPTRFSQLHAPNQIGKSFSKHYNQIRSVVGKVSRPNWEHANLSARGKYLMSHSLVCWRCGASLAALSLPLRRLDVCKACNAELHVCKMCVEYDTSYAKHCKEPTAEEVRKKDEANFCDHFKPKAGAYVAKNTAELARVKSALDDLFKK